MPNDVNSKSPSPKNRRKQARKTPRSTAKVECRRGTLGLGTNLAAKLLDLSESGVGLILNAALKPDEEVEIIIRDVGQSSAIKQIARVCWCVPGADNRFVAGFRFERWLPWAAIQQVSRG